MPTLNPRINVTVTPPQYDLLSRLAKHQGKSRAAVLLDLFETVTPVLERVVVALDAAGQVQAQATAGLKRSVESAEQALRPLVATAQGQLDMLVEQALKGSSHEGMVRYSAWADPSRPAAVPRSGAERHGSRPGGATVAPRRRQTPRPVTRGSGNPKTGGIGTLANAIATRVKAGPATPRRGK
jgi:uncharacterized protein (DUF1778 family)